MEQENHPLEGGLELKAREVRLHVIAGEDFLRKKWYSQAKSCFYDALALQPGNLDAHLGIGQIHLEAGAYGKATERFQKVLNIDPAHVKAQELYTLVAELSEEKKDAYATSTGRIYEADLEKTIN